MFHHIEYLGATALLFALTGTANAELKIGVSLSLTGPSRRWACPRRHPWHCGPSASPESR